MADGVEMTSIAVLPGPYPGSTPVDLDGPVAVDPRQQLRRRAPVSCLYFGAYIVIGVVVGILGPSVDALAARLHSTPDRLSSLFLAVGIGFLVGALGGGVVLDRSPARGNGLMCACLLGIGAATCLIPIAPTTTVLHVVVAIQGIFSGALDSMVHPALTWLHGKHVGPWMQALHVCFGVGALLSPLTVGQLQGEGQAGTGAGAGAGDPTTAPSIGPAFWLFGCFSGLMGLAIVTQRSPTPEIWPPSGGGTPVTDPGGEGADGDVLDTQLLLTRGPSGTSSLHSVQLSPVSYSDSSTDDGGGSSSNSSGNRVIAPARSGAGSLRVGHPRLSAEPPAQTRAVLPFFLVLGGGVVCHVGCEMAFGDWVYDYATSEGVTSHRVVTLMGTVYWISVTVGRLLSVFLCLVTSCRRIVLAGSLLALPPFVLLLLFPGQQSVIWFASVCLGLAVGPVFPCIVALPRELDVVCSGRNLAILIACSNVGNISMPFLAGKLLVLGPAALPLLCLGCGVGTLLSLWLALGLGRGARKGA